MGLEIRQSLKLSQQLVMTPQLQQAIKLLQLSRLELADTINQELLENPLLEISEETAQEVNQEERDVDMVTDTDTSAPDGEDYEAAGPETELAADPDSVEGPSEQEAADQVQEEFDWENYLGEYSSAGSGSESVIREDREAPSFENMMTKAPSLRDHLLWQLSLSALTPEELKVGEIIVESLGPDGYLPLGLDEVAEMAGVPVAVAEKVLAVVQQCDPLGVAARDLRECLLIQATELYPAHDLLHDILENHLGDLEKRQYNRISKTLGASLDEVAEALDLIRSLDPRPGRKVSDDQPQYITPDIYVYKMDGEFVIVLNEDGLPKLKVNSFYKDALATGGNAEAKEYVQGKLRSALWLIRSIHQRQRTIYKVTEAIVKFQREFFDKGIVHLKPLVLRDVAEEVGMHESTISRVTTNKYVHTPQGVFELKYFFNSRINKVQGGAVASESVKERIRQIVSVENQAKPLSDQAIADMLMKENIDIARRTVAKYREMLGILPSSRRRQVLRRSQKGK